MIRVALADDQALVRSGFAALLQAQDDIEVVGEAADGLEVVGLATRARADVILLDIRMPGLDGIEATRRIARNADLTSVHVVILTTFELDEYVFEAIRAGHRRRGRQRAAGGTRRTSLTSASRSARSRAPGSRSRR